MKFLICFMMLALNAAAVEETKIPGCFHTATEPPKDLSHKVLVFPRASSTDYVKLIPAMTGYHAVTVCHRSFTDLQRDHSLFSLSTTISSNGFLIFVSDGKIETYIHSSGVQYGSIDYAPNQWHSICTTWNSTTGLVQVWLDGQALMKKYITTSPIVNTPIILLAQEQDSHGGAFDVNQSFMGMMTDVHMWNYVLSHCEIQNYMKEQPCTPGNVVNWTALNYQMAGNVLIQYKETGCDLDLP